jgi:hypothetical protein
MEGSTTDHRVQLGLCWSRVTEKALAGSVSRVHPPSQPPAKKVCNVATSPWVAPVLDAVVEVVAPAAPAVLAVEEEEPTGELVVVDAFGGEGWDDDVAAPGCAELPQPAATDAVPTSEAMVTAIRTVLITRG